MDQKVLILKMFSLLIIILSIFLSNRPNIESKDCPIGYFRIGRMERCHQLLDCSDYKDMTPIVLLSRGLVKRIHLVQWNDNYLIVSNLSDPKYVNDFSHNIQMLRQLSHPLIIQLIGWCDNNVLFTEYHSYGNANHLPSLLKQSNEYNNISLKLNLCLNYVKILDYLHNSPIGVRVMCDSNTLHKTLSQYLLTKELTLVLNDLDALPQVIPGLTGVKCGHRQLFGSFVAPEQLWNRTDEPFDDKGMPEYDHKTDIWKIPDVCDWFLSTGTELESSSLKIIRKEIKDIHNQCKRTDPQTRPTAKQVLNVYQYLYKKFDNQLI